MSNCSKDPIKMVACVLVLVGALNWGLVGAFQIDLVALIFGAGSLLSRIVYIAVGVAAVYKIVMCGTGTKGSCSTK